MRIKVEIGDDFQEYTFDRKGIFVGADPRCQLSLPYEEVGAKHLKIVTKDSKTYLQDLSSGESTYYNNKLVAPGRIVELSTFFPIEVGGILIYLLDDVVEPNVSDELGELFAEDEQQEDISEDVLGINEKTDKKKDDFKRDIFAESHVEVKEKSFTLTPEKVRNLQERNKTGKHKITTRTARTNANKRIKREKRIRKEKTQEILKSSNLKISMIFFIGLFFVSGVYYTQYYKPSLQSINNINIEENFTLKINNQLMKKEESLYREALTNQSCLLEAYKGICQKIKQQTAHFGPKRISINSGRLFIGLDLEFLETLQTRQPNYTEEEFDGLQKIVVDHYSNDFTWAEFLATGLKSKLIKDTVRRDRFYSKLQLVKFLTHLPLDLTQRFPGIVTIHLYVKSSLIPGEIEVTEFLKVNPAILQFHNNRKKENDFLLKTFLDSYLLANVESFISSFGSSKELPYSSDLFDKFRLAQTTQKYREFVNLAKCSVGFEQSICDLFFTNIQRTGNSGVSLYGNSLYFIVDTSSVAIENEIPTEEEYNPQDKKAVSNLFRNMESVSQNFTDFIKAGFIVENNLNVNSKNIILINFLKTNTYKEVLRNDKVSQVYFISIDSTTDKILNIVGINKNILTPRWVREVESNVKYFYKSRVDIFSRMPTIAL